MNVIAKTSQDNAAQAQPWNEAGAAERPGPNDGARLQLCERLLEVHRTFGWSKNEIARRIGMKEPTFNQYYNGKYAGNIPYLNNLVENWLEVLDDQIAAASQLPESPVFLDLKFAREVFETLRVAQVMPALVMVSAHAGIGKTVAAERFAATNANVHVATMSPATGTLYPMLNEIAEELELSRSGSSKAHLVRSLGKHLKRKGAGTLLVIDEAQHLSDECINQLRHFVDRYQCGAALLGNNETYRRYSQWVERGSNGQLRRRIFKRVSAVKPDPADLARFIEACGITDEPQVKYLTGIGMKAGALGQIDMTVRLAKLRANGDARDVTLEDLKKAWANRDVEQGQ